MNTTRALTLLLALALLGFALLALSTPTARAADPLIVRVKVDGATSGSCGGTWGTACDLQYALTRSIAPSELWVAAGTYTPTTSEADPRLATFQLQPGVALYGGFAMTETLRSQRNFTTHVTILSGDLNGDDNNNVRYDEPTRSDNAYHVVTGSGVTNTAVLDGFTVTGGNSNEYSAPNERGGGIYNDGGSPTFNNLTLANNSAYFHGGGMYNDTSSPTVSNVTFSGNSAGFDGGGMANTFSSRSTLTNVTFSGNSAYYFGGGIFNSDSNPTLTNVTFVSNTVYYRGGGMYNDTSSPVLNNVTFSGNSADSINSYGGGMYNDSSNSMLSNVTFSGNSAWVGGGMHNYLSNSTLNNVAFISNTATGTGAYGGMSSGGGSATLTNVTFSGNSAGWYGGGLGNETKAMTLTNVTFISNTASRQGGGMINYEGSATLTNVTFSGNTAGQLGGGMYSRNSSNPTIRNAIFWGNTAPSDSQVGNDGPSTASLSDSVVQGGYAGGTNIITSDPHLGALGDWGGATQTIRLLPGSSAIDAGNNSICPPTDQRGKPRVSTCDIGAFEFQGYTLTKTDGDQQTAQVNTPFADSLQVTLTENEGGQLAPGITITFTAPSSGASAAWSGSLVVTATTNASGVATVGPPTANGIAGSYVVTATTPAANPPATFALTNLAYDSFLPLISR